MYANEQSVRTLCINVRSGLASDFILEHGETVDEIIDAKLGEVFWWPISREGVDLRVTPPTIIIKIANRLTAAYVERTKYAVNEANGNIMGNPYASNLEKSAMAMLTSIAEGNMIIPALEENIPIRQSASPPTFVPPSGRSGGSLFRRNR